MLLRRLRDSVDQAGGGFGLAVEEGLYPSRAEMSRACPRCPEGGRRTALASSARGPSGSRSAEYLPLSKPRPMGE